ncbi:MAG: hypothetical protein KC493_00215 [Bacteriovoracaceae bacterium]|nr:hypothetical protein [Bacteriovoracaceae bacterium]
MNVTVEVPLGELVDKLSILRIKQKFITDEEKLIHVNKEESVLTKTLADLKLEGIETFLNDLIEVNTKLWKIEDDIRDKERSKKFDQEFIDLARAVYVTNDLRFEAKGRVNDHFGSGLQEVKSYQKY